MKERPISFKSEMVLATKERRKTQTRRLSGLEHINNNPNGWTVTQDGDRWAFYADNYTHFVKCPYGQPGDMLWVRETWGTIKAYDHLPPREIPKGSPIGFKTDDVGRWCQTGCDGAAGKWRPSIFMPRWASRITLEIVSVRVERVQEISEEDSEAEGAREHHRDRFCNTFKESFQLLWGRINGKTYPWDANPYVWVIEFKVREAR